MESLVVLLTVDDNPLLDQNTRALLRNNDAFKALQPDRAEQAWGGTVPGHICFIAQAQETALVDGRVYVTPAAPNPAAKKQLWDLIREL